MADASNFVQLSDGAKVHVKLLGGDDKSKPLLIALHGAPGLSDHTEPLNTFGFLSTRLRILVYDARGSGISDRKLPYTDERWVADVEELRAWVGDEKFILAGGSYGGFISQQYILAHPERVSVLILRSTWSNGVLGNLTFLANVLTSPRIKVDVDRQLRLLSGNLRDNQDFEEAFAEIAPIYSPPKDGTESTEKKDSFEGATRVRTLNYEAQNVAFSHNLPRFDVRARLHEISAPTLVIAGAHDPVVIPKFSEELAQGIPNSKLVVFEHSGHAPPADEPEAFRESLSTFLASLGY